MAEFEYSEWKNRAGISEMKGKTFTKVYKRNGDTELVFENDEERYVFFHSQDCCESVTIDDIVGDLEDLQGSPLIMAEEYSTRDATGTGAMMETFLILANDSRGESYTYTFYKFATIKGYVDIRWFGESNGYYSEDVDLGREVINV